MALFNNKNKIGITVAPLNDMEYHITCSVANLQGIGARAGQEDSFTVVNALDNELYEKEGLMFAVCDGMGGMKGGKSASETAVNELRKSFAAMDKLDDLSAQLKDSLRRASDMIYDNLGGEGGSTAVAGIVRKDQFFFASVGDSFLWLFRDGKLIRLNREHNICHDLYLESIRDGSLDPSKGKNSPETGALTSFLGVPELTDIDGTARPLLLYRGDTILACSDGVGGTLTEEEVIDALSYPMSTQCCEVLQKYIIEHAKPNQDNYTAIVLKCI